MKRIFKWLESKFSRRSEVSGRVESHEPGKNVLIPNKYESDHTATLPTLTSLEESSFVVIESTGFDPYNSGSFDTSKSRESRSRK